MDDATKNLNVPLEKNLNIPTGGTEEAAGPLADPTEIKIPLLLIVIGLAVCIGYGLWQKGSQGAVDQLLAVGLGLIVEAGLGTISCFVAAYLLGITFGPIGPAILKMAAITIFPYACCLFIPQWVGPFVKAPVYWYLIGYLFDLEPIDVIWTAAILGIVNAFLILALMTVLNPVQVVVFSQ